MKILLQRVKEASVTVDGQITGSIGHGLLMFVGFAPDDNQSICDVMLEKALKLRIFSDENDKINLSVKDINGEILAVSQFTLYADCRKGTRPGFSDACPAQLAEELYNYFLKKASELYGNIQSGVFGADMSVSLINDGPFTVMLDSSVIVKNK